MIYFHNPGEIDLRAATIAGLSAKDNESPIGYFGTGLKYSIACILRWGGSITIYSGVEKTSFSTNSGSFRGKEFNQVFMNETPLGFTTDYGKNWEPWQVFRELYANALDEGGGVSTEGPVRAGQTIIAVDCDKLNECYNQRDSIILPINTQYSAELTKLKIINVSSPCIYYRGVRVLNLNSALTYNILNDLKLTEDRTVGRWEVDYEIQRAIKKLTDENMILKIVDADEEYFESNFSYSPNQEYSPQFINIMARLYKQNSIKYDKFKEALAKYAPEAVERKSLELSPLRQQMLIRAKSFLRRMDLNPDNHSIIVADLSDDILGMYEQATGKIYLSPEVFNRGTKQLVSTLYEEILHAETGKQDCTYNMQTFLFNKIISLYEELFQEFI